MLSCKKVSNKRKKSSCKEESFLNSKKSIIDNELEILMNEDLTESAISLVTLLNKKKNEKIDTSDMFFLAIVNSDIFSVIYYLNYVKFPQEIIFRNGMTPLILSIKSWRYKIAYCLLKVYNNVDYIDFLGKDVLFYALQNSYIDSDYRIAKIILQKHPNPSQTLLMLIKDGNIDLIKYLIENTSVINENKNIFDQNIFDQSLKVYSNDHPIIELLNKYK